MLAPFYSPAPSQTSHAATPPPSHRRTPFTRRPHHSFKPYKVPPSAQRFLPLATSQPDPSAHIPAIAFSPATTRSQPYPRIRPARHRLKPPAPIYAGSPAVTRSQPHRLLKDPPIFLGPPTGSQPVIYSHTSHPEQAKLPTRVGKFTRIRKRLL